MPTSASGVSDLACKGNRMRHSGSGKRMKLHYHGLLASWHVINRLLNQASSAGKGDAVALHLVGATLQSQFPDFEVENHSYSTADDQLGRPGDFYVGDTVFHVTVNPAPGLYEKCKRNLEDGYRVYVLVPDALLVGARQNAELVAPGRIFTQSVESFVAQNVEELSCSGRIGSPAGLDHSSSSTMRAWMPLSWTSLCLSKSPGAFSARESEFVAQSPCYPFPPFLLVFRI